MKPLTGPVHRVRQFLSHTRSYGLGAATRRAVQSDVLGYIVSAELAIRRFEKAPVDAKRGFVAHALFRRRSP